MATGHTLYSFKVVKGHVATLVHEEHLREFM